MSKSFGVVKIREGRPSANTRSWTLLQRRLEEEEERQKRWACLNEPVDAIPVSDPQEEVRKNEESLEDVKTPDIISEEESDFY